MWGWMILLLGMIFHSRSDSGRKRKTGTHRQLYRDGKMREELDALDTLHEGIEMNEQMEKQKP